MIALGATGAAAAAALPAGSPAPAATGWARAGAVALALALIGGPFVLGLLGGRLAGRLRTRAWRRVLLWGALPALALGALAVVLAALAAGGAGAGGAGAGAAAALPGLWDVVLALLLVGAGLGAGARQAAGRLPLRRLLAGLAVALLTLAALELLVRLAAPPPPAFPPPEAFRLLLPPGPPHLLEGGPQHRATACQQMPGGRGSERFAALVAHAESRPRRVLHIGDSLVWGAGVARDETFTARLEALTPGVAHVNAGVPETAPDAHLLSARGLLPAARFERLVLYLFPGNDIGELDGSYPCCPDGPLLTYEGDTLSARCPEPRPDAGAPTSLGGWARHSPPPYPLRVATGCSALARWATWGFLRAAGQVEFAETEAAWDRLERILRAFVAETQAQGVALTVVLLPFRDDLERAAADAGPPGPTHRRLRDLCAALDLRCLDAWELLAPLVRADGGARWFLDASRIHLTPEGHTAVARWLLPHVGGAPEAGAASERAGAGAGAAAGSDADAQRVRALVAELARRGRCSLLMGCPAADAIAREGRAAVPALIELAGMGGDRYWRQRAFDLLGRGGDDAAVAFLRQRLGDPAEPLRPDAALALGHRRAAAAADDLRAVHAATPPGADPALRLATAYALARLGDEAARAEVHAALAPDRTAALNPGQLRTLLTAVRWLDERDRPDVQAFLLRALGHDNRFVRAAAVRLVRDWSLRAAVPALIPLLEDESPGIRDEALATLQSLTGFRYKQTRAQWEAWCEETPECRGPRP